MNLIAKNNKNIIKYSKLNKKKYRQSYNMYIVEGLKTINEALKVDVVQIIYTTDHRYLNNEVDVKYVDEDTMFKLYDQKPIVKYIAICKIIEKDIDVNKDLLVLNKLSDPGNVGNLIRSAVAFNINNIIIDNESVDIYNKKTLKSMHGANFHANIIYTDCYEFLKDNNYNIITTFVNKNNDYEFNQNQNAIVLGNEAIGIEAKFADIANGNFKIDIEFESLNVASAGAILLYELKRSK